MMGNNPILPPERRVVAGPPGGHPRDVWVDVTTFGAPGPRVLLAEDGRELEIAELREAYVHGRLTIEEFERRVGEVLS